MQAIKVIILLFLGYSLSACSSFQKDLDSVEVGTDKGILLETIGSPTRTERVRGHDKWTYIYYDENDQRGFGCFIHSLGGH